MWEGADLLALYERLASYDPGLVRGKPRPPDEVSTQGVPGEGPPGPEALDAPLTSEEASRELPGPPEVGQGVDEARADAPSLASAVEMALPPSATFRLVVHPTRAEPQVNVYRKPRSAESFQQEARQEHERAEQCEARLAQTQAEQGSPGSLTGLIDSGLVKGEVGIAAQDISNTTRQRPGEVLRRKKSFSYRAEGRVAVALEVKNTSAWPWTVDEEGVVLVGVTFP
jgi:Protein of unknown function (DUF2381)